MTTPIPDAVYLRAIEQALLDYREHYDYARFMEAVANAIRAWRHV